jgi:SAM-dependent methyltransferase
MTAPKDWWKDFFSGLFVDFWRGAIPAEMTRADADFIEKNLAVAPGARVLDLPCGPGRLTLELARRGYRMTGVDISSDSLEYARAEASAEGLAVDWRLSDMRDLLWRDEYDAAFCAGNSFGYFDDAGNADYLAAAARVLKPGARFLLESGWVAESILPNFRAVIDMEAGGVRFTARNTYDPRSGRVENVFSASRGNDSQTRQASHRVYTVSQILRLLEAAGCGSFEAFGSPAGEPYRLGSHRLLLVATKLKRSQRSRFSPDSSSGA